MPWRVVLGLSLLGPLARLGLALAARDPEGVEVWYTAGLFPRLRAGLSALAGLVPVSASELLVLLIVTGFVFCAVRNLRGVRAGRRSLGNVAQRGLASFAAGAGALYLVFLLVWGLNHARPPVATLYALRPGAVSLEVAIAAAREFAQRAAEERAGLPQDAEGVLVFVGDGDDLGALVEAAFERAAGSDPRLAGAPTPLRFALASRLLTSLRIAGIYSPFSGEAHVNARVPAASLGLAACHEVAHARGFAREDAASYVGWRVARDAPSAYLRYSAAFGALRAVLGALHGAAPQEALALEAALEPGVGRDLAALRAFWRRHRGSLGELASDVNDLYLRSQGESRGVASYGGWVELLFAERALAGAEPR